MQPLVESKDASRAQSHPGVHLVLTGRKFPIPYGSMPVAQDEYPLARERVRYVGDPVAGEFALMRPRLGDRRGFF